MAANINIETTNWIYKKIFQKLKKLNFKAKKILVVGVSYKKNIDDTRESAALKIIKKLKKDGFFVKYYDPYAKDLNLLDKNKRISVSRLDTLDTNEIFDCSIIITDHDRINYKKIVKKSNYIFDTRNVLKMKNKKIFNL